MPVVWKQKFGMKYLYQPFYTQQLGVFSKGMVEPADIVTMLSLLYKKFRFAGINLNTKNLVGDDRRFKVYDKTNYVLNLARSYGELHASFSVNARRNIKKATEKNPAIERNISCGDLVAFKRENDTIKRSEADYDWLRNLLETLLQHNAGEVYAAVEEGVIQAAAFFGFSKTRGIYLLSASNAAGKENRSMFKLVDAFIRDHAGTGLILDFEGSNIPNVARFFTGFGAHPEIYQGVSFDRLPVFLNKLRKHD
jgi:hypothetical protein